MRIYDQPFICSQVRSIGLRVLTHVYVLRFAIQAYLDELNDIA